MSAALMQLLWATAALATLLLLIMWAIAWHNARYFPRLAAPPASAPARPLPIVSILIPARNEAETIAHSVADLLAQDYASLELIVLDDHSCDGTAARAQQAMGTDPRARVLKGKPLPPGWLGKHWACHQLAQAATADYLLFADADVRWHPHALAAIIAHQQETNAALLTIWPRQRTITWAERLVTPLMPFILLAYLPVAWAHDPHKIAAAAANGQCMLFTRTAYSQIGGHEAVRANVLDDVSLARAIKRQRLPLRMADAGPFLTCRMYHGWQSVRQGFSKNILAAHGNAPGLLILSTVLHLLVFTMPFVGFVIALWLGSWPAAAWAALLLLLGVGVRARTGHIAGLRLLDALWMPLSVLLFAVIAASALWQHWRHGGPRWKGRRLSIAKGGHHGS